MEKKKSIQQLILESKKHLKENNIPLEYISKYISKKNNLSENEVTKQISEFYLNKFLKSNSNSFEKFLEEELNKDEIEEDGMTMSSIPVSVRPEKPIEEIKSKK